MTWRCWSCRAVSVWPALLAAGSPDARAVVINAMLAELHASHTEYLLPDQEAYYQLAVISLALRRPELRAFFPSGEGHVS
jgi:carboxyl-terminal processing protease